MKFKEMTESSHKCPHCGGPMFSEMMMMEKKDACYYKVKASAKVWPSAYASGRLVQCRKKGAGNYGNKSEGVMEMDKSQTPPGRDGSNDSDAGKKEYTAKATTAKKAVKDGEKILNKELNKKQGVAEGSESDAYGNTGEKHECGSCDGTGIDTHDDVCPECGGKGWVRDKESSKKQGVAEDQEKRGRGRPPANDQRQEPVQAGRIEKTATGVRHHADPSRYGGTEPEHELDTLNRGRVSSMDKALGVKWDRESKRYFSPIKVDEEDTQRVDSLVTDALKIMRGSELSDAVQALKTVLGDREYNQRRGHYNFYVRQLVDMYGQQGMAEDMSRRGFLRGLGAAALGAAGVAATGNAQARATPEWMEKVAQSKELLSKGLTPEQVAKKLGVTGPNNNMAGPMGGDWGAINYAVREVQRSRGTGTNEEYNPEYDDEAGMADNNLETLQRAVEGIDDLIDSGDNLPEWCQEKIAVAKSMLVAVWDYMYSEEASDEVDPEIDAMFEAMDQLAEEMAAKNNVSADLVWEQFESMPDNILYETAAWRRKEGKSKKGGLNAKGVASYRRENPGSKLQTAVTTKPSKLKPGSKAAKRRKSFCARMGGVKGPMKKPNGKPTRKALALRKWNC